jgi:hypothetical protein
VWRSRCGSWVKVIHGWGVLQHFFLRNVTNCVETCGCCTFKCILWKKRAVVANSRPRV